MILTIVTGVVGAIAIGFWTESRCAQPTVQAKIVLPQPPKEEKENYRIVKMEVTAYCPCEKCCKNYADGITASGHKIQPKDTFVAADKRYYPFGTEMIVPGYANNQPVKVLDRGGAIKENCLDVFFPTHQEALEWGRRKKVKVKIYEPCLAK